MVDEKQSSMFQLPGASQLRKSRIFSTQKCEAGSWGDGSVDKGFAFQA